MVEPWFWKKHSNRILTESYKERERAYHKWRARKSPQNRTQWKKMQAKHRKAVIEHKKKSWEETATSMPTNTPIAKVWEAVRRMRGRPPRRITILEDRGVTYRTNEDISNKLATTFAGIFSFKQFYPNIQRS